MKGEVTNPFLLYCAMVLPLVCHFLLELYDGTITVRS